MSDNFKSKNNANGQKSKPKTNIPAYGELEINGAYGGEGVLATGQGKNPLTESYEKMLGIVGRFKGEVLELSLFDDEKLRN